MHRIALAAAAAFACAAPAAAQAPRPHDVPRRPALWAEADTNSSGAYHMHGVRTLERDPQVAAAAFYWAARLRPGWAEPLYGRRVALLMSDPDRLVRYMEGNRSVVRSPEIAAIDSLQLRALSLDPFLVQVFDRHLLRAYMVRAVMRNMGDGNTRAADGALAAHLVENWLNAADPSMRAWLAYSEGRFPKALEEYQRSVRRAHPRDRNRARMDLGRIHYFTGNYAQAAEQFTTAAAAMRTEDARDLVYLYESKALVEHSLGAVYEKMGNADAARETYARALQEDLSFGPAHRRLSALALAAGDTATAAAELALALEASPGDAALRVEMAVMHLRTGRAEEALADLRRAAADEPYFALPHLYLARLHDSAGIFPSALQHYRDYLARAARDDEARPNAVEREAALDAQLRAAP
jgi:tetratricopeptide (TPR) repeat protein